MGGTIAYYIWLAFFWYAVIASIWVILQENRSPVRAIAWILVLIFMPVVGLVFYYIFGRSGFHQGRIARKIRQQIARQQLPALRHTQVAKDNDLLLKYRRLVQLLATCSDAPLFGNNRVETFVDGGLLLEAMLGDIERAHNHIHVEYFILEDDKTGTRFIEALLQKAAEGVEVRIIYDGLGSMHLKYSTLKRMRDAGIKFKSFGRIRFPFFTGKLNYRNHRKILVVDGKVAYLGGFNIADRYTDGLEWGVWRDTHIRFQGDAVAGTQNIFLTDWLGVTGKLHKTSRFFPVSSEETKIHMQVVRSGPDRDWQTIMLGFCEAIYSAQHSIDIQTPYFLPNESVLYALQTAAMSGVQVRVMLPARSDSRLSYAASMSYMETLMASGVRVYLYEKGFIHSKTLVIDNDLTVVGSANMDYRSFEQNFEVSAFIYDEDLAVRMHDNFTADLRVSRRLHPKAWSHRPHWKRLIQSIARLFSPIL